MQDVPYYTREKQSSTSTENPFPVIYHNLIILAMGRLCKWYLSYFIKKLIF